MWLVTDRPCGLTWLQTWEIPLACVHCFICLALENTIILSHLLSSPSKIVASQATGYRLAVSSMVVNKLQHTA